MHTCISSHGLKRSWRSCPRRVNADNKNTPSKHHPRRRNVTTLMVGLKKKNGHIRKISPKSGEPQRYCWGTQPPAPPPKKKKQQKKESSNRNMTSMLSVVLPSTFHDLVNYHHHSLKGEVEISVQLDHMSA